jgi:hypothetical protein
MSGSTNSIVSGGLDGDTGKVEADDGENAGQRRVGVPQPKQRVSEARINIRSPSPHLVGPCLGERVCRPLAEFVTAAEAGLERYFGDHVDVVGLR